MCFDKVFVFTVDTQQARSAPRVRVAQVQLPAGNGHQVPGAGPLPDDAAAGLRRLPQRQVGLTKI